MDIENLMNKLNCHLRDEFNINQYTINIKLDKSFDKLLYIVKKTYIGIIDGKLYAKGIDFLKTSTLPLAAKLQKQLLELILFKNQLTFTNLFNSWRDEFFSTSWNEQNVSQITLMQRVTKHPSKYTTKPAPAQVAEWMIQNGKLFYPGLMVPMIVTGYVDGKIQGVHPESIGWKDKVDVHYIWNHQILPKLARITEVVNPHFDWKDYDTEIVEKRKKKTIKYQSMMNDTKNIHVLLKKIENDIDLSNKEKECLIKMTRKNIGKKLW